MSGKYRTIVADPPWSYDEGWPISTSTKTSGKGWASTSKPRGHDPRSRWALPYPSISVEGIAALPVSSLAADDAHLYLWTTNRYLRDAYGVAEAWGFKFSQLLIWAKAPRGLGPGGAFAQSAEFILFCRRGSLKPLQRMDSVWWSWKRTAHSVKPEAFLDLVEQVSPGPYVELFARRDRLGWDTWGDESLGTAEMAA